ncbi:MAG: N-acetylmuramoyl-L-alanine amidase [Rhizobacter sp.]|nr:N-acetylmuramoyl-L-alanine amidase [Rhizobacter sp.]
MLKIQNHRLVGPKVSFSQTPNIGSALQPRFVVLHYTAGSSLESSVRSLCTRKPQGNASAHVVLGRDGRIVQLASFNVVTWHAGISHWNGLTGLNQHAIGIEMDNAGRLHREGDKFVAWFGRAYPNSDVQLAEHRHGGGVQPWHTYPQAQIERALELSELLVAHYGLEDVLGHEDISRGRKTDPGPAFPLQAVRSRAMGRGLDEPKRLIVTASSLNIRSGPGAGFDKVALPLPRGTELLVLEAQDRWSHVAVVGPTDLEGWVSNDFVVPLEPVTPSAAPRSRGRGAAAAPAALPTPRSVRRTAKRAATRKPTGRKAAATKSAASRPATTRAAAKRATARKATAKKATAKRVIANKAAARKVTAKKASTKRAPARKTRRARRAKSSAKG